MRTRAMQANNLRIGLAGVTLLIGFGVAQHFSYLLFHSLVEFLTIIISVGMFILVWNLEEYIESGYLRLLGAAYLAVAWLDFFHTLAFKGMGVFPGNDANMATQFWVAARYVQAVSLVVAPFVSGRKLRLGPLTAAYMAVALLLTWMILGTRLFPVAYVEGHGLTTFKIVSEYLISLMFLGGLLTLAIRKKENLSGYVLRMRELSLVLGIFSELAFTYYVGVTDFANALGHYFKAGSFVLIYLAVISVGLRQPYSLMFQDLKRNESTLREERDFFSAVLDTAGALVVILDPLARIVRLNRACEELTGYLTAEAAGKHPWDLLVPAEDVERTRAAFAGAAQGEFPRFLETAWVTRSGERRVISWTHTAIRSETGAVAYIIGSGMDITERRRTEERLLGRAERLRVIVESVQTGVVLVDAETHRIVDANPAFLALIGQPLDRVTGQSCHSILHPEYDGRCPITDLGHAQEQGERVLVDVRGAPRPVLARAIRVRLDGKVYILESFADIADRKVLEEELRTLSLVDELTGLYNRRGFLALATQQAKTAGRTGHRLLLLFLDVNDLKAINDINGHAAGDAALAELARVLKQTFRESDIIARLGGDEFVVLTVEGATESAPADADVLIARLMQNLEAWNGEPARTYRLSVSVGTAHWDPDRPVSIGELVAEADRQMYVRKRSRAVRTAAAGLDEPVVTGERS